jgi:hypothetical protein
MLPPDTNLIPSVPFPEMTSSWKSHPELWQSTRDCAFGRAAVPIRFTPTLLPLTAMPSVPQTAPEVAQMLSPGVWSGASPRSFTV